MISLSLRYGRSAPGALTSFSGSYSALASRLHAQQRTFYRSKCPSFLLASPTNPICFARYDLAPGKTAPDPPAHQPVLVVHSRVSHDLRSAPRDPRTLVDNDAMHPRDRHHRYPRCLLPLGSTVEAPRAWCRRSRELVARRPNTHCAAAWCAEEAATAVGTVLTVVRCGHVRGPAGGLHNQPGEQTWFHVRKRSSACWAGMSVSGRTSSCWCSVIHDMNERAPARGVCGAYPQLHIPDRVKRACRCGGSRVFRRSVL